MSEAHPAAGGLAYLDYAATAPLLPVVRERMIEVMNLELGNPSSLHAPGHHASTIIEEARSSVARLINADPEEIIFTSGGSEANNTVANIFAGKTVVTSAIEHPSVLEAMKARAKKLEIIKVDREGFINSTNIPLPADLISVMLANNELGSIEPIAEIVDRLQEINHSAPTKTYLHSDATQALGKIHIDVKALGVDYLTISAHKIGGPVGIGALYVKKGSPYRPLILGGHQENKRRAGTSNTLLIAGFGTAAQWCYDQKTTQKYQEIAPLRDLLARRILQEVPHSSINSPLENCLPNILNVSFQAAEGESIQLYLDAENIIVSTGSACAAGDIKPSHVLMATKNDAEVAHSSIRFSLGVNTAKSDIDRVMSVLPRIVTRLQGISTIKIKE